MLAEFIEKKTASDVEHRKDFITGENIPFENVSIKKDDIWSVLVNETIELWILMCSSVPKQLKKKVNFPLPDGIHS